MNSLADFAAAARRNWPPPQSSKATLLKAWTMDRSTFMISFASFENQVGFG
jgi:hypothetical protein